jgi:hypothetical protein
VISKNGEKAIFSTSPGQTVQQLIKKVSLKFRYPETSVRLFFSGRELRPTSSTIDKFEIGKHGNFLLHLSTTTIEIFDRPDTNNSSLSRVDLVDLTSPGLIGQHIDLTSNSPRIQDPKDKKRHNNVDEAPPTNNVPLKRLRVNISRALNHRLCILENRILSSSSQSSTANDIMVEFIVQDPGVSASFLVHVGLEVTCTCDHSNDCSCQHILFILMKVRWTISYCILFTNLGFPVVSRPSFSPPLPDHFSTCCPRRDVSRERIHNFTRFVWS